VSSAEGRLARRADPLETSALKAAPPADLPANTRAKQILIKFFGGRRASAVIGLFLLAVSSTAAAEDMSALRSVSAAVKSLDVNQATAPLGSVAKPAAALVQQAVVQTASAINTIAQPAPAAVPAVASQAAPSIATEAAWLYKAGWPLYALVDKYSVGAPLDEQANCLATAVYFEARGESLEGQLAVARVVMNRAASGRYPPDWCSVVKQPWQFSFVRNGQFPAVNTGSAAWARAQGIARIAMANVVPSLQPDVLWYHATYVAPSWGHRLNMVERIGAHIFYRA
jgi:N-acetylmuramoyl-L-alanine amidase